MPEDIQSVHMDNFNHLQHVMTTFQVLTAMVMTHGNVESSSHVLMESKAPQHRVDRDHG